VFGIGEGERDGECTQWQVKADGNRLPATEEPDIEVGTKRSSKSASETRALLTTLFFAWFCRYAEYNAEASTLLSRGTGWSTAQHTIVETLLKTCRYGLIIFRPVAIFEYFLMMATEPLDLVSWLISVTGTNKVRRNMIVLKNMQNLVYLSIDKTDDHGRIHTTPTIALDEADTIPCHMKGQPWAMPYKEGL
jgi:hypothetical protein